MKRRRLARSSWRQRCWLRALSSIDMKTAAMARLRSTQPLALLKDNVCAVPSRGARR